LKNSDYRNKDLSALLKNWAGARMPPRLGRVRLLQIASEMSPPVDPSPLRSVLFQPFLPLDWSRFTYNKENPQIFQVGLPWNRHIA
jgi:hypothetical protein